jgi:hypothetical protein
MGSFTKLKTKVLLTSVALLCTTPLAAALKTKSSTTRVKARTAAPVLRLSPSSRTSSHNFAKTITPSSRQGHKAKLHVVTASKPKFRGQQSIDQIRTLEIQQALIREHYLDGEATGEWDQATRNALTRFQGDNHWQIKILPDARALIKLGLGPRQQNLLNPESAAIASPYQAGLQKPGHDGSN